MARTIQSKVEACKRLIKTCDRKIAEESFLSDVRGVKNLGKADLNIIIMYCEYFIENKTIGGLMPPRGAIAQVLRKIEIC